MSAPDQSDDGDNKGFLARWSQRKQEAKQPEREAPVADAEIAAAPATEAEATPEFDLSSLPSLDELTSETDITAFLRKGVPEHLRNAALRKSWALDPAIRNYVNPALEYAYDWNTPGGVPGNGELGAGVDVARMVSQIMGTEKPAAPPASAAQVATEIAKDPESPGDPKSDVPEQPLRLSAQSAQPEPSFSSSDEATGCKTGQKAEPNAPAEAPDSVAPQHEVRRHGSAKPVV
ncbi:MAG: DUF3306 domain-containing protein [Bradyrhizobium sp.]|nr:DUF3306 domain-containing protein [Bradyrhizobium sp.]